MHYVYIVSLVPVFSVFAMGLTVCSPEFQQMDRFHPLPLMQVPISQAQWFDSHVNLDIVYMEVR